MRRHYLNAFMILSLGFLSSCGSEDKKTAAEEAAEAVTPAKEVVCTFSIPTPDSTKIAWTAYKTTDKVGVGGSFTEFEISGLKEANTLEEAVAATTISIPVASVFTKNPERDTRIKKFFFGVMDETTTLTGSIKELENGNGKFSLTMNGIETSLPFIYKIEEEMLVLSTTMDVASGWNAQAAIDALNEECKDLHAGADGVTKLWSEVDLVIKTPITKSCSE